MTIYIDNFSIEEGEPVYCSSPIDFSVEVTDPTYGITLSGTGFTINGADVVSTFTPIAQGYRVSYITTPSGNMLFEVTASNNNAEASAKEYGVDFGYKVTWDEVAFWEQDTEIPIVIQAENTVSTPNTTHFSTFFRTHKYYEADLGAEISSAGSGGVNLPVYIHPQTKYFVYGKTYSVTISGIKDFSGNTLDPMFFTFKIENN